MTKTSLATASRLRTGLAVAALLAGSLGQAAAQGYFIPPSAQAPKERAPAREAPRPAPRPAAPSAAALPPPPPVQLPTGMAAVPNNPGDGDQPLAQIPTGPVPDLPALPKGATPPAAVIGVLGVPDIMHAATASQQVEKEIAARREKLNADAQKEQAAWREMQQQLTAQRASLSPDQVRAKERELQDRITNAQKSFRERNQIIQETAQYSLGKIEQTLIAVIRQVAESRGMNLVLHRAQVALNVNEFDITDQVVQQMNKVMPSITLPPDGVAPTAEAAAPQPAPATPAAAPPAAAPAKK